MAAGEQARWLPRRRASDIAVPGNDFWLFDEQLVRWNHFAGDGSSMGGEISDAPFGCETAWATPQRRLWPQETFHMYDDTLVSVELLSAQVDITQPSEIALYLKAFEELRAMAVHGSEARALIAKAIDALN